MASIDNLKDIEPLVINTSRIGQGAEIPLNILNYTKDNLTGVFLNTTSFILFISLLYFWTDHKNIKGYDIYKSAAISSGYSLLVIISALASGWSKDIYPLLLYGSIFLVSTILVYIDKKKGN